MRTLVHNVRVSSVIAIWALSNLAAGEVARNNVRVANPAEAPAIVAKKYLRLFGYIDCELSGARP